MESIRQAWSFKNIESWTSTLTRCLEFGEKQVISKEMIFQIVMKSMTDVKQDDELDSD